MKPIIPGVSCFTGLLAGRVYVIEDSDGLTLIDTGIMLAAARILKQLRAAGFQPGDVKRILITHAHPDHAGGLPKLKAETGAEVMASALEKPVLLGEVPILRPEKRLRPPAVRLKPAPVDRVLEDGEMILEVMGGLQALHTPGHAPGHLAFWNPGRRILFCGDVIFNMTGMGLPWAIFTVDMAENKRSIRRLASLEPEVVCFGHGNPLMHNTAVVLRAFAEKVGA